MWKIPTCPENISTQVEIWGHPHSMYAKRGGEGSSKCVQLRTRERASNFGDFSAYELCDDVYKKNCISIHTNMYIYI